MSMKSSGFVTRLFLEFLLTMNSWANVAYLDLITDSTLTVMQIPRRSEFRQRENLPAARAADRATQKGQHSRQRQRRHRPGQSGRVQGARHGRLRTWRSRFAAGRSRWPGRPTPGGRPRLRRGARDRFNRSNCLAVGLHSR